MSRTAILLATVLALGSLLLLARVIANQAEDAHVPTPGPSERGITASESATRSPSTIIQEKPRRQQVTTESDSSTREYHVVSLCGLELETIQVARGGRMASYPIARERLSLPGGLLAGDVLLAPGHGAFTYQSSMGERIELSPVLGVVFHAQALRARTMSAMIDGQDAKKAEQVQWNNLLAGFTGPDDLALALGEATTAAGAEPPKLVVTFTNGRQLTCNISPEGNGMYRTELPLVEAAVGDARVVIECGGGCRPTLKWWPTVRDVNARDKPRTQQFPWGSWTIAELVVPEVLEDQEAPRLHGLVTGQSYSIGALCLDHSKFGKVEFVAQSDAEIVLPMRDRLQLIGSVTPHDIAAIRIAAEFYDEPPAPGQSQLLASWHEEQRLQVVDGRFVAFFPSDISISPRSTFPLPPYLVARAYVAGCDPKSVVVPLSAANAAEAELAFYCHNDIALSSEGMDVDTAYLSNVLYRRDGRQVIARVRGARRVDDRIYVDINEEKSPDWQATDRPDDLVAVVVADEYYDAYACCLAGDYYKAVSRSLRKVSVHVDPSAAKETVWVGWRWRGIDACHDGFTTDSLVPEVSTEMHMPSDIEGLWISTTYTGFKADAGPPPVSFVESGGSLVLQWP